METCFYCNSDVRVETAMNPWTKEIHPACARCRLSFNSYIHQRLACRNFGCIAGPLILMVGAIVALFELTKGLVLAGIGIGLVVIFGVLLEHYVKKKNGILQEYDREMQANNKDQDG